MSGREIYETPEELAATIDELRAEVEWLRNLARRDAMEFDQDLGSMED